MPSSNSHNDVLRAKLNDAIALHRAGKSRQAARQLERLAEAHPRSAAVAGYLGGVYLDLDNPQRALVHFRRATSLAPKSELASVGMFHSLWSLDAVHEAFDEMRRFLKMSDSKEYGKLLRDLTVEGRLVPQLAAGAA
jgi:predicted Zn-dependent protease